MSLGDGYYRIVDNTDGMVADSWGDTADGAPARQAAWNGGDNQQWSLNSVGDGRYQIVNRGSGTALDGRGQYDRRRDDGPVGAERQHQQRMDHHNVLSAIECRKPPRV